MNEIVVIGARPSNSHVCKPSLERLGTCQSKQGTNNRTSCGVIEEEKLQSFNIIHTIPHRSEEGGRKEGSFSIDHLEMLEIPWAACGKGHYQAGTEDEYYNVGSCMRSVAEPLLVQDFGASTMDPLFDKYSKILSHRMANGEEAKFVSVTVSMTRI